MKKILYILVAVTFLITILNMSLFISDSFSYNLNDLPTGEFLYSSMSPSGDKTLKLYKVDSPLGKAVRGELVTIDEKGEIVTRNIYWNIGIETAVTGWIDENNVSIDGTSINTSSKDYYDCRDQLRISNEALEEKRKLNNYNFE